MISIVLPSYKEPRIYETMRIAKDLFPDAQVIISPDDKGQGKGWAVRKGVLASLGEIIIFIDGDGNIHPRMIKRLLPFLEDYDVVVGSKGIGNLPFNRKIITLLSRVYIRTMFGLSINTQTGIKAFNKNKILPWMSSHFVFDIELLYKLKHLGVRMIEVPIEVKNIGSKSLKILWGAFIDSLEIWWRLNVTTRK